MTPQEEALIREKIQREMARRTRYKLREYIPSQVGKALHNKRGPYRKKGQEHGRSR